MDKARITTTNQIVRADALLEHYPNYNELEFICIDENCSVRMSPTCIKKTVHKKPHFKKYKNKDHIETCEYATGGLYQKGGNQKLNKIEIEKIGYPSVFNLNDDATKKTSKARLDNEDQGVTGSGNGISKLYEFDSENTKFDRKNRVQSIERIVKWYLDFPNNRDVEIEINGQKIQYRHFFKNITDYTDPKKLIHERIFYGKLILSKANENIFNKYPNDVYFKFLARHTDKNQEKSNYSVKIDKDSISKRHLSRIKNKYENLFQIAFEELKQGLNTSDIGLYVFVYGEIDEKDDTLLNVKQHHIAFRYDEVRKTIIEK
uniref:hypothetical protein n=1 Tax=Flavobacterium sp. TaxID=239 RepID=UPI00159A044B|nr:hypothetical protein [Flavobacterium sp.]QJS06635.1 hypothetical protein [Flavobacterium sp.]